MTMASTNINHEGYHRRLEVVQEIMQRYGLEYTAVTPVEYIEACPFYFNNYIYRIDLAFPATADTFSKHGRLPGTILPPKEGISTLILRLSNPKAEGLNNANRVENEVAASYLIRQSFSQEDATFASLVPAVYAWQTCKWPQVSDERGFAWTLLEYRPGGNLDAQFSGLSRDDKYNVIQLIADVVTALQKVQLPAGVTSFGGLTFDSAGEIVSGQYPLLKGGPWADYTSVWVARLRLQLEDADRSPVIQGWKQNGVREQIEWFISEGGVAVLLEGVEKNQKSLIHGDLTMNNMLYDASTKSLTAFLDFDWASVIHPCHEFFTGLWDLGGGTHPEDKVLQTAVLIGNFSEKPTDLSDEAKDRWELAELWDDALAKRGAIRPSTICGIQSLEKLRLFEDSLCPFQLGNEVMLKRFPAEKTESIREQTEKTLLSLLQEFDPLSK